MQRPPQQQQSSLGIPWQSQLLRARRSSSCSLTRQDEKPAAMSWLEQLPGTLCTKSFANPCPGGWWKLEKRAGHQEHSVIAGYLRISSSALLPSILLP